MAIEVLLEELSGVVTESVKSPEPVTAPGETLKLGLVAEIPNSASEPEAIVPCTTTSPDTSRLPEIITFPDSGSTCSFLVLVPAFTIRPSFMIISFFGIIDYPRFL